MPTLNELLEDLSGIRNEVATEIADRFDSIQALAASSTDKLTAIKGVGAKTAERIIDSAKQAAAGAADATADATDGDAATPAAAEDVPAPPSTGEALEAKEEATEAPKVEAPVSAAPAEDPEPVVEQPAPAPQDDEDSEPSLLEKVAAFVGGAIGIGVGLLRGLQKRVQRG